MPKSVFTPPYASFLETLIALRKEMGVSQVELAERLGKSQQFVSRFEHGIRRLDVVEFYAVARALRTDPTTLFAQVIREFPDVVEI